MILVAGHAARVQGAIHEVPNVLLLEALQSDRIPFAYLRHDIRGEAPSEILIFGQEGQIHRHSLPALSFPSAVRYAYQWCLTILVVVIFRLHSRNLTFIGINPLNAIVGALALQARLVKASVFYAVDYSPERFPNRVLNAIYHYCDRFAVRASSQVWNVSTRIHAMHSGQTTRALQHLVPNCPMTLISRLPKRSARQKQLLFTNGLLEHQFGLVGLFVAIRSLRKQFPYLQLHIAGDGFEVPRLNRLAAMIGIADRVKFLGYLNHSQLLEALAKSGIGLALYTGEWSFNYYGDSMKCREFASLGIPIVTTNSHATTTEILDFEAGVVCRLDPISQARAIQTVLDHYDTFARQAFRLGKKHEGELSRRIQSIQI